MNKKSVVINKYYGGLGNQMFQYVFGLNLESQGRKVLADTSWYQGEKCEFCLKKVFPYILLERDEKQIGIFNEYLAHRSFGMKALNKVFPFTGKMYREKREFVYDARAICTLKTAVSGYWQCCRYVHNVSKKLKEQFVFTKDLPSGMWDVLNMIKGDNAVFLHVRGGDYVSVSGAAQLFGNICTKDYYQRAVSIIKSRLDSPSFWVFTNDKKYAKSILANMEKIYFVSDYIGKPYEDWIDLMLMSKCKHAIIANSSFSWWGAWLIGNKDKIIIAPEKWVNRKQDFNICEPYWIKI